jgi:hypothetical protein
VVFFLNISFDFKQKVYGYAALQKNGRHPDQMIYCGKILADVHNVHEHLT